METKLFTEKQINISALLAGPIPPGFLIYKNYRALGKEKQAYIALASTLLFTVAFFYALFQVPDAIIDKIPNFVFTAFYGILVMIFFRWFMAKEIDDAFKEGAKKGSNWAVTGMIFLGLFVNLGIIFGLAMDQPFYDGEVISINGNALYYDADFVSVSEANKLVEQFRTNDFFGNEYGNIARLQVINDAYVITMVVDESLWTEPEIINSLQGMKGLLEIAMGKPTQLILESVSLTGTSRYREI